MKIKSFLFIICLFSVLLLVACDGIIPNVVPYADEQDKYTITLNYNNGRESETYKVDDGDSFSEPPAPTYEGYVFLGWYHKNSLYDFNRIINTDITIDARWEKNENVYTVCYVLFDSSIKEVTYVKDSSISPLNVSEKGYKFLGWYQEINGEVSNTAFSFKDYKIESNIKFMSKWEKEKYTISFDTDGGSSVSSIKVNYNEKAEKPENPKKLGYEFDGWYEKENDEFKNTPFDFDVAIDANIKLYAKWVESDNYQVTFENEMNEYFTNLDFFDFKLPSSYEGINEITWESSDKSIVTEDGKLIRPYVATSITLEAKLKKFNGKSATSEFSFEVPGYKLENATTVASTYLYRNYSQMTDDLFEIMDIIYCAFATVDSEGNVTGNKYFKNVQDYIIPKAKKYGVYVVMVLAPDSSWTVFTNPVNNLVDTTVNNVIAKVNEIGFDGVDIDWERPKSGQETWFTNFASALNNKVKTNNSNHLVSAAITGGKWQPPSYDLTNSGQYLDYINVMTYGMERESRHYQNALYPSSHSAVSCSIHESIPIFNSYGIASSKLLIGLAFYGIKQTKEDSSWGSASSVLYNSLVTNYINNSDYTIYFDDVAKVPYIMNSAGTVFISYDNEQSIQAKCEYIITNGVGGVMAWEAGCDTSGTLINAVKTGLNK